MVRKLKHHEQKLLRKVDFATYKSDGDHREAGVLQRYAVEQPTDYTKYNKICGSVRQLAHQLAALPPDSAFRHKHEALLLEKLYDMGILSSAGAGGGMGKLSEVEKKVTVSAMCRRRLAVVMTRLQMADDIHSATKFIKQGHVRVGTDVVRDPAYMITRTMEDFVTWTHDSKIKKNILRYRDKLDDFDLI